MTSHQGFASSQPGNSVKTQVDSVTASRLHMALEMPMRLILEEKVSKYMFLV